MRHTLSCAILLSCYISATAQVEIDTTTQSKDETLIEIESGTPLEDYYIDGVVTPKFESELDSINFFKDLKLQRQQDSIARVQANLDRKSKLQEEKQEEEEEEEEEEVVVEEAPKVKEDNGYGIFSMFEGNPGRAGLYSLIVPGLGQAYNKRWWKIPLAIGAEASVIYILQNNIRDWNRWDEEYRNVLAGNPPTIFSTDNLDSVRRRRNAARQNKDYAWIALIGVHIIVAADAFVDRHLIEFDVDDDLSIKASPMAPYPGLNLVMTF